MTAAARAVRCTRRASPATRARSASKICASFSRMRSSARRILSSYSFSSGVMKRSPPAMVCLRT